MLRFIIKRILQGVLVLLAISILIFVLSRMIQGDPARVALGPTASEEAVQTLREQLHLDKSLPEQYAIWIGNVFRGEFGLSTKTRRSVSMDIQEFLPATLELIIVSGIIMIVFSIMFGRLAARKQNTWIDSLVRVMSYVGVAMPAFVWAVLFLLLFGHIWRVIPVLGRLSSDVAPPTHITGLYIVDGLLTLNLRAAWDALLHVLLPAISLAIGSLFQNARILRSSLTDNMGKEYITVSRGYGIPEKKIYKKYLFKPSMGPVVSVLGLSVASAIGNAFLVETVYYWPGLSKYGVTVMLCKDLNAISAVVLITGLIFLIANTAVDIISILIDPTAEQGGN